MQDSERARALEQALRALAYDIGTVRDVAARRGDPDVDHRLMLVRLDHWRSVILNAIAPLEAVDPPPSGASPQADATCEHGTAMDVHCCNCHSGFIFDMNHECPSPELTWREAVEQALGVENDPENHTPSWAFDVVRAAREIGNAPTPASSQAEASEAEQKYGIAFGRLDGESIDEHIASIKRLMGILASVSPVEPESSSFEANTASNLLQKVELSTLDRYRNTNQMDVDTWMVRAVASSEPRSEDDLVLLDHVIALLKPTVEPEPPTNPPCARCGHALSAHRPEFGACDGRDRPCACPEYQVPTAVEAERDKAVAEVCAFSREQGVRWLADKDFTTPLPPRPPAVVKPHRYDLVRYGVTWEGQDNQPLLTPMPDGYWTPWHLAVEAPTVEPEPCVWRESGNRLTKAPCFDSPWFGRHAVAAWKVCPYCGAPMKVEREP